MESLAIPKPVLVLDFGSQYTNLIVRRVREHGIYCELVNWNEKFEVIQAKQPQALIFSGGPSSVYEPNAPTFDNKLLKLRVPILGICYGMQLIAKYFAGKIERASAHEYGKAKVDLALHSTLFNSLPSDSVDVWMSHGDKVVHLPDNFFVIARTKNCPIAGFYNPKDNLYGLQFHPEVTHTEVGNLILANFLFKICNLNKNWNSKDLVKTIVSDLQGTLQQEKVILALSGGVDSSVAAMLLQKALGSRLTCIFVDHGLLRLNEADTLVRLFKESLNINVLRINAKKQFFAQLAGIVDAEQKRKVIGNQFIKIFEQEAKKQKNVKWLAQGTIYPDVIESGKSKESKTIKSHHNVGGLPEEMDLKLVEPLKMLFKDEVRKIGLELGLPREIIYQHPFPGPGLGVRILGEVREEYVEILQQADAIFIEELRNHNLYSDIDQALAVFLPIKTVGVVGDNRREEYVISLRAVKTIDFMTASVYNFSPEFLELVSNRIINEVGMVSRVVYDVSSKPPATIEWQ